MLLFDILKDVVLDIATGSPEDIAFDVVNDIDDAIPDFSRDEDKNQSVRKSKS